MIRVEVFWSRVNDGEPDACWEWTAGRFNTDYGMFSVDGRPVGAHRIAWRLTNGPIPDGICVCHHCDNPPCCNPGHLFLGTHKDNADDRDRKGRWAGGRRPGHGPPPTAYERLPRGDDHWARRTPERLKRGEANPDARLTEDAVREIRRRAREETNLALAAEFGVSNVTIGKIVRGLAWVHVT